MATEFQPYVGPRPYERNDPALFFGRDREADELVSLIFTYRELLFYAQSGVGKTSLLNASVIPQLEKEGFEVLPLARVQGVIPKDLQPDEIKNLYIFNTLMSWTKEEINPRRFSQMSLTEYLKERKHATDNEGEPLARALIFDQFEEIFTLYQDRWNDRNGFFKQISDALKDDNRLLRVIFTIREDYIAQLDPYAPLLPEKLRTRFRMERLRKDAALSAVTGPLKETNRSFAKGVADKLVEDLLKTRVETIKGETIEVSGEFVEPVQLQVVCQNLWLELPSDVSEITEEHLLAFGGVDRPLSRFYEGAVKAAATEAEIEEKELRQWCEKWLITSTGTRGIVHRGFQSTEGIPNTALDILEARHLINSEWRSGARWYELTHDRLIDPIRASNDLWNKQRAEKANQASLMISQAEQSITLEKYERALDAARSALDLSEEVGDLQGQANALFYIGKAYEVKKQYDKALTTYSKALELVKQTDARDLEANLLKIQGILSANVSRRDEQLKQSLTGDIALLPKDSLGYNNRAFAYYNLKEYERAIEDYNHVLELEPSYVDAYYNRGLAYYNLKEYERAIEDYNHALELEPSYVDAYYNRGLAYYNLKQYKRTIEDYNHVLELEPSYVDAYYNRGLAYFDLKQYEQAITDYNRALELDPKYVNAYYNRGIAYFDLKQYEQAITDYNRALELDPKYVDAYYNRGIAYFDLRQYEQAITDYNRALELDPKYVDAYYNRGNAYFVLRQYERAIADYNRALELGLTLVDAYNGRGNVYFVLKQYEQAITDYNRALELDPKYVDAYYNRGNAYFVLRQYEQAITDYNRVLELDPTYFYAYLNRGRAYYAPSFKEYERAIQDIDRAIELDPQNDEAYLARGYTYLWLKDIKLAQKDFMRSWHLDSTNVNYGWMVEWTTMCQEKPGSQTVERLEAIAAIAQNDDEASICRGVALWLRGNFEKAETELNRANSLEPELEDSYFWKGVVLAYIGQDGDAITAIEKAIELDLPPLLLSPLRWLEQDRPDFYRRYAAPLLVHYELDDISIG